MQVLNPDISKELGPVLVSGSGCGSRSGATSNPSRRIGRRGTIFPDKSNLLPIPRIPHGGVAERERDAEVLGPAENQVVEGVGASIGGPPESGGWE